MKCELSSVRGRDLEKHRGEAACQRKFSSSAAAEVWAEMERAERQQKCYTPGTLKSALPFPQHIPFKAFQSCDATEIHPEVIVIRLRPTFLTDLSVTELCRDSPRVSLLKTRNMILCFPLTLRINV